LNRYARIFMLLFCAGQVFLAVAFFTQMPIALQLWPLPDTTPMSFIFISSIFAAAAAAIGWCILSRDYGAMVGLSWDFIGMFVPITVFSFQLALTTNSTPILLFALAAAVTAVFGFVLLAWSVRIPIRDPRPMPRLVYYSFIVFVIALVIAGVALVLKVPNILPWRITPEFSVMSGWFYLGASTYFLYSVLRPSWHNTAGQLMGFMAYDVILLVPFLQRLPSIPPEMFWSLVIYIAVVVYSGVLATYYLLMNPATRVWSKPASV